MEKKCPEKLKSVVKGRFFALFLGAYSNKDRYCERVVGVPITDDFEHLAATITEATPLYELCASVLEA